MKSSLIFDLILLAVMVGVAISYARKGFLAALLQFLGNFASLVGSILVAREGSVRVFEQFLRPSYTARVEEAIRLTGSADLAALAEQYAGFLPQSFRDHLVAGAQGLLGQNTPAMAEHIVEQMLEPLTLPMLSIVLFFVSFALLRMVLGFLVALFKNANKLPLLGGVNRFMGFALGGLAGLVDLYIILSILFTLMTLTDGQLPFLNPAELEGSFCLQVFDHINPFFLK